MVCERLGHSVCEEQISVDMMQQRLVVSELFSSVCAEIRDEVRKVSTVDLLFHVEVTLNYTVMS